MYIRLTPPLWSCLKAWIWHWRNCAGPARCSWQRDEGDHFYPLPHPPCAHGRDVTCGPWHD